MYERERMERVENVRKRCVTESRVYKTGKSDTTKACTYTNALRGKIEKQIGKVINILS